MFLLHFHEHDVKRTTTPKTAASALRVTMGFLVALILVLHVNTPRLSSDVLDNLRVVSRPFGLTRLCPTKMRSYTSANGYIQGHSPNRQGLSNRLSV